MKCQICGAIANVHLTQIIGGKMQKIDLCDKCAKEKGVADPTGFSLADMLLGLGATENMKTGNPDDLQCPECGFSHQDFKKTGRLGCPTCYETFNDGLQLILKDMHKDTVHKGKIPAKLQKSKIYQTKILELQTSLQEAVRQEKYELAAALRDQIQQIQTQIGVS
ncbi:MAG: UvrB/UvrC motif-containing protein [Verrucomicrobiota bacterium]